jgi:NADH:ubiquinone oxidoreductase subunit 6 (subunit J)
MGTPSVTADSYTAIRLEIFILGRNPLATLRLLRGRERALSRKLCPVRDKKGVLMTETLSICLLAGVVLFAAIQILRSKSLLLSALWLAGVSVSLSVLLYMFLARHVAVIELSVGAGLVTVLLIFAIGVAGDDRMELNSVVPRSIAGLFILLSAAVVSAYFRPFDQLFSKAILMTSPSVFLQERSLDLVIQVVVIFSGVLGLVGILAESKAPLDHPMADEIAALRDQDLRSMEHRSSQPLDQIERERETLASSTATAD